MNRRKVNRRIENIIKELKHRYDSVGKPNHGMIKVVNRGNYGFFNIGETRDLFASAVQKGLQSPASVSIHDTVGYEITQFADEYQVAALEK